MRFYGYCVRDANGEICLDEYPHWQAVYYYFNCWKTDGTLERINRELNQLDRKTGKNVKHIHPYFVLIVKVLS